MRHFHIVEFRVVGGVHDYSLVRPGFESESNHFFFFLFLFGAQKWTLDALREPISMYISVSLPLQNR